MKRVIYKLSLLMGLALTIPASGQDIQFVEQFAMAEDRGVALEKLIPGTEDYYYFYSLHFQNNRQLEQADELMKPWVKRFGNSARAKEIQNRQALLKYDDDPNATLEYLKRELGASFNHQREIPEAEQNLPTALDQKLIAPDKLVAMAMRNSRNTDRLENTALPLLADRKLSHTQLVHLLSRVSWPDFPNLVQLIEQELNNRNSKGFGRIAIHNRLTFDQLQDLVARRPRLKNETNFVYANLAKLKPSNDVDWSNDPDEQEKYLARLWNYVSTLDPVHNSLKACVRYHQLMLDQSQGKYDRQKFISYLKLPRRLFYVNRNFIKQIRSSKHEVNLNADYRQQTRLIPIQNDEALVRDYLHQFLETTADLNEFSPFVESDYLKTQLATTNILQGLGDVENWASLLTPESYKSLIERTDLDFAPTNRTLFKPDDSVELKLFTKNVDKLIIKVFEINTENYYRRFGREIDTDINLDGLVPNDQQTHEYDDAPAIRVGRNFKFPKLNRRGVYVIDFIGNGKSSRAIIRKGQLSILSRITFAGHEFTVVNEAGDPVSDANLWIAGQLYEPIPDDAGNPTSQILVPFSTRPQKQSVIIRQGEFCSLEFFNHQAESYSLAAGMHIDRETLLRSQKSQIVVRAQLQLSGVPVPVGLLEDVRLQITTTDLDGNSSTTTKEGLELSEIGETIVEFQVPPRLQSVQLRLLGQIENVSLSTDQTTVAAASVNVNQIDGSDQIQDVHLVRSGADYLLSVRGKSGEIRPRQAVLVELKSELVKQTTRVSLQSDENGQVNLGELAGIDWIAATCAAGSQRKWNLERDGQTGYSSVHSIVGNTVRVAAPAGLNRPNRQQVSLFEVRGNTLVKDWFESIEVSNGLVGISGLQAGDYQLVFKKTGEVTLIRVTEGKVVRSTIMGATRRLETRDQIPLHVQSIQGGDEVKVQLGGTNVSTRVHVFASRYMPRFNAFDQFQLVRDTEPFVIRPGIRRSTYMAGRKIGDEYQYILDRRYAKKFVGNMLERPTLLLNPFSISQTENQQNVLNSGDSFGEADDQAGSDARSRAGRRKQVGSTSDFSNLDFLKNGTMVLANLKPDEDGVVVFDREKLGDKQHLVVVAADAFTTVQRSVATQAADPEIRDLRLANAFDPDLNVSQSKKTELLQAGKEFLIENILTAKFQSFDDLGDIYSVLQSLNPDNHLAEFRFILSWPDKTKAQKQELYSRFACHELNFFIARKDGEFFRDVVKPYLKNKREKTFLDHYLLNENLDLYLTPWRFARLNSVERILLSQRLEDQQQDLIQHLNDLYRLNPTSRGYAGQLYDSTVAAGFISGGELNELIVDELKAKNAPSLPRLQPNSRGRKPSGLSLSDRTRNELLERDIKSDANRELKQIYSLATPAPAEAPQSLGGRVGKLAKLEESEKQFSNFNRRANSFYLDVDADGEGEDRWSDSLERKKLAKKRKSNVSRLYRRIAKTQEWIEQQYYKLLPGNHTADRVPMNQFWRDFANHRPGNPFISSHFSEANRNFTEMMFALSVLDMPFKASEHKTDYVDNQMRLTPGSPIIALHQQMRPSVVERRNTTVLVSENFFQKNDRYRHEDGQQYDKFINDKFSAHTLYGGQVVITNPTSTPRSVELLVQIPSGAVVASGSQATKTTNLDLQPFSTQSFEYSFYFPTAGDFGHFPAHVASNEKVVAVADQVAFKVVDEPVELDKKSWAFVSQNGSNQQVIDFLNQENVLRLALGKIAFRMKDAKFYDQVVRVLRNRYVFNSTLWSYSLQHNDIAGINEYLEHQDQFVSRCGIFLESTPLTISPVTRNWYEHREYRPLINARAHQVGADRKILNQKFHLQYHKFAAILARRGKLTSEDRLALTYYLLLQDRIDEAIGQFEKVDKAEIAEAIQYDYCNAYVNMYLEKPGAAEAIAQTYVDYPVDKWRTRFQTVLAHVEEIRGGAQKTVDPKNQTEAQTGLANREAAFDFEIEDGQVTINYQNLSEVQVNYYQMDIELLFSRNPFSQSNGDGFSLIRPNQTQTVQLDDSGKHTFDLPESVQSKNVTVEITGKNKSSSQAYYAHQLSVQMIENYGQLKVTGKENGQAISKAYIKVYARNSDGSIKFFKDGYTDLRGRFDYATQSNYPLDGVQRFSVLVMSEEFGTTVRQAAPPKE